VSVITRERALTLLTDLIAIPSVNPMGRDLKLTEPVEGKVADYIEALFQPYDVTLTREAVSPIHENLLIFVPGKTDLPATLLESHMDTVPAEEWSDRAFTPRIEGDIVIGRGACDDKGPLASMILAVLDVLETGAVPTAPILFLAAGDEENAQLGIRHFREKKLLVGRGVFGEPTNLVPIVQHKGTLRWDITVHGKSAHTSRPELGVNAIHGMIAVIAEIERHQEELRQRTTSPMMTGPSLTVSRIQGGRTRNAVPDECTIALDFRLLPGMDLPASRAELLTRLDKLGLVITHSDLQIQTPSLNTATDDPFSRTVLEICRRYAGSEIELAGVPYGTDASWISDRAPALVLGPGSIATAHAIDEEIDITEVVTCAEIYREILLAEYA
jgi:acetylornithine deacetylase/succinyl-diaminopimelate desuccinylase-like protein